MRSTRFAQRLTTSALALVVMFGSVGCSTFRTSHFIESDPGPTLGAVASADGTLTAQPFSLVAADSIGLATFGTQIVYEDLRIQERRLAEAN